MATKIFSCLNRGLHAVLVEVEADILQGLSNFSIVGLGDMSVHESKERIRSAIKASGVKYPQEKKIINLAPAHLRKAGPHFDLPMATALLAASGQIDASKLQKSLIIGELALDGAVRPVNGVLSMAIFAQNQGWEEIILPVENAHEAEMIEDLRIVPVHSLDDLMKYVKDGTVIEKLQTEQKPRIQSEHTVDFSDIRGQDVAKRALIIAAAGGHHIALTGPPGTGKTLLAKAFPTLLPPLTQQEKIEVMQIYSCAGLLQSGATNEANTSSRRPFRQVHPTCTHLALIGGGTAQKPGEISLAHRGALFLDEIAEFPRQHLESLRQPLEDRTITITRTSGSITYPAQFTLIASMNPCPCGYLNDKKKDCSCKPYRVLQYQKKLSGPIRDRIDLTVKVPRQSIKTMASDKKAMTSRQAQHLIQKARNTQQSRFSQDTRTQAPKNYKTVLTNSEMGPVEIKKHCRLAPQIAQFLTQATEKLALSGRQYHQTLKVARTIADLENLSTIQLDHIAEALQYKNQEPAESRALSF